MNRLEEAIRDAVAAHMTSLYVCSRVWSAWSYGTMSQDDFRPAGEDDEVIQGITDGVLQALASAPAPAPVAVIGDTFSLAWIGTGPIAPIIRQNGLKVGDRLYAGAPEVNAQLVALLREASTTLKMWADVAPAVSLVKDIDATLMTAAGSLCQTCAGEGVVRTGDSVLPYINACPACRMSGTAFCQVPGAARLPAKFEEKP